MPPDSAPTKARLLRAAFEEFTQYGLAGARVDRIAEKAASNKRLIYVYYGNKEQLFDAVLAEHLGVLADAVPFTPDDLAGYAGAMFDHLVREPQILRLAAWHQLERPETTPVEADAYRLKVEAVADAQRRGTVAADIDAVDLLALVLGQVTSWFAASPALRTAAPEEAFAPARLERHRAALTAAVRTLTRPGHDPGSGQPR
ncbi:TetR family transcriptional regulator [Kitasatospora sp. NPDC015120]|uniref:TetR family transcriptional regulator n=1 Tax=Kitasatospora sp. NPDC015120 TaxID=3364023 RepID=UPI0036F46AA7